MPERQSARAPERQNAKALDRPFPTSLGSLPAAVGAAVRTVYVGPHFRTSRPSPGCPGNRAASRWRSCTACAVLLTCGARGPSRRRGAPSGHSIPVERRRRRGSGRCSEHFCPGFSPAAWGCFVSLLLLLLLLFCGAADGCRWRSEQHTRGN